MKLTLIGELECLIIEGGVIMSFRIGSAYIGSPNVQTSKVGEEIISNSTTNKNGLYAFSFLNQEECTVIINSKHEIFLRANQGFNTTQIDAPISSFKIKEPGVKFNWLGAY